MWGVPLSAEVFPSWTPGPQTEPRMRQVRGTGGRDED